MENDSISRQAAIDALADMHCKSDEDGYVWIIRSDAWARIDALPSVTPKQRWIPCSDENPKADGRYLITGKMGTVYSLDFEDGRWYGGIKPVAWIPLPEPYREDIE